MKLVVVVGLVAASGCMKQSEKYCAMHPEDTVNCPDGGGDGGMACVGDSDCLAIDPTRPVCTADRRCAECTVDDAALCTEGRVCTAENTCGDCTRHDQCASAVCQANGRCADEAMVAYVSPAGGGSDCTKAMPCDDLVVAEGKVTPIIKVSGTVTNSSDVVFSDRSTTIYGDPGAAITRDGDGVIVTVENTGTTLVIYDLRIFGATGGGIGHGVYVEPQGNPTLALHRVLIESNDGSGVRATDGGDVTISRSVIANNTGSTGVVLMNGTFAVSNTIIAQNGRTTLMTSPGGANLQPALPSTFEFNTVADNVTSGGAGFYRGIFCTPGVAIANSIIAGNDVTGCNVTYTLATPGDGASGAGNVTGDPMFTSTTTPSAPTFYRIDPASPAKDIADTAATLAMDIDGNMRPIDGRSDAGADEVVP